MICAPRHLVFPAAFLTGLAACLVMAADTPSDPLKKLRHDWQQVVEKDTKTLRDQYAASLLTLERELAGKGDYAGAAKAKRERQKVQPSADEPEVTAPTTPGAVEPGQPVSLEPGAATLAGGVTRNAESGILSNWSGVGAAARWLLPPGLRPGGYEVELTWSCAPDSGGDLVVKEDRYSLRRTVKASSSWDVYQTEIIGTLRLIANSQLLELSAAAVKGSGLLQLKSIRLLPVAVSK